MAAAVSYGRDTRHVSQSAESNRMEPGASDTAAGSECPPRVAWLGGVMAVVNRQLGIVNCDLFAAGVRRTGVPPGPPPDRRSRSREVRQKRRAMAPSLGTLAYKWSARFVYSLCSR